MRSLRQTRRLTRPLAVMSCAVLACAGTALAEANHEGWPQIGHHQGHPNNESGVMRGQDGVLRRHVRRRLAAHRARRGVPDRAAGLGVRQGDVVPEARLRAYGEGGGAACFT